MIRPELLRVEPPGTEPDNAVTAKLTDMSDRGVYQRLELDAGVPIVVFAPTTSAPPTLTPGHPYAVVFDPDAVHILDTH